MVRDLSRCSRASGLDRSLPPARRRSWLRAALVFAAATPFTAAVHGQTEVRWLTPASGWWMSPGNWSTGLVPNNGTPPGSTYHVIIDAAGPAYSIDYDSVDTALDRFTLNSASATFYHNCNTIQIQDRMDILAGSYVFELNRPSAGPAATIRGGMLNIEPAASFIVTGYGGTQRTAGILDGVTVNGRIDLPVYNSQLEVRGGLNLNGTIRTTGDRGRVVFQGAQAVNGGTFAFDTLSPSDILSTRGLVGTATLTLSSTTVVRGGDLVMGAGGDGLLNYGRISADVADANGPIEISGLRFDNHGTIEAINGGNLDIGPRIGSTLQEVRWTNTGTMRLGEGSRLTLGGRFTTADIGTVDRTGGQLVFAGELTNHGSTLVLDATAGPWFSDGGIVRGGEVVTGPGGGFQLRANPFQVVLGGEVSLTLDGTRLVGDLNITETGARVELPQGLEFTGTLRMAGTANGLLISNASILSGPEVLLGDATGSGSIMFRDGAQLTIAEGTLVHGSGGIGRHFPLLFPTPDTGSIVNRGTIVADNAANAVSLAPRGATVNHGIIRADGGSASVGQYFLPDSFDNQGRVEALNGGSIYIGTRSPVNIIGGTLTGGTWEVSGFATPSRITFETQPILGHNAATVILRGPNSLFPALGALSINSGSLMLDQGRAFTTVGDLTNAGELALGTDAEMIVTGSYTQTPGGSLVVTLVPGLTGQLAASGALNLDGGLAAVVPGSALLELGQSFLIMSGSVRSGIFASLDLPALPGGLHLDVVYSQNTVSISVVPAPAAAVLLATVLLTLPRRRCTGSAPCR